MDRTTIIRNLSTLFESKLIEEIPGPNKRNMLIQLTSIGAIKIEEGNRLWDKAQEDIESKLGHKRMQEFMDTLKELDLLRID
ncbi:MAG: hypothetical protein QMB63_06155 [Clostridiaceae bacterium]